MNGLSLRPLPLLPLNSPAFDRIGDEATDADFEALDRLLAIYLRSQERDSLIYVRWLAESGDDADLIARGWDAAAIRGAVARYPARIAAQDRAAGAERGEG